MHNDNTQLFVPRGPLLFERTLPRRPLLPEEQISQISGKYALLAAKFATTSSGATGEKL